MRIKRLKSAHFQLLQLLQQSDHRQVTTRATALGGFCLKRSSSDTSWSGGATQSAPHLQIFQCTVARTKEVVSGSLSGATQDSDSGDWTQLFPPQDQGLKGTRLLDFQITTHTRKMLLLDRVLEYLQFLPFCPNIQNMDM